MVIIRRCPASWKPSVPSRSVRPGPCGHGPDAVHHGVERCAGRGSSPGTSFVASAAPTFPEALACPSAAWPAPCSCRHCTCRGAGVVEGVVGGQVCAAGDAEACSTPSALGNPSMASTARMTARAPFRSGETGRMAREKAGVPAGFRAQTGFRYRAGTTSSGKSRSCPQRRAHLVAHGHHVAALGGSAARLVALPRRESAARIPMPGSPSRRGTRIKKESPFNLPITPVARPNTGRLRRVPPTTRGSPHDTGDRKHHHEDHGGPPRSRRDLEQV